MTASSQLLGPRPCEDERGAGRPLPWVAGPVLHDAEPTKLGSDSDSSSSSRNSSGRASAVIAKQLSDSDYGILKVGVTP